MVRRYALRVLVVLAAVILMAALVSLLAGFHSVVFIVTEVLTIALMLALNRWALPIVDRWDRGASGEEHVGALLDGLADRGWLALHDATLGRGNIDHVLVGPAGLFAVETKSHGGRITVANIDRRVLKQAYAESKAIERVAGTKAEPLLVFSRAYLTPAIARREGVLILPARMLARHLARRTGTLSAEQIAAIYARVATAVVL